MPYVKLKKSLGVGCPIRGLPSYQKPPVVEVVYAVIFSPLPKLTAAHTGIFWKSIEDKFPSVKQTQPIGALPRDIWTTVPRIWYVSEDENTVVQVQNNRFVFNWRKVRADDVYPRFEVVESSFQENFSKFLSFLEEANLGGLDIRSFELSYINHIERMEKLSGPKSARLLFPDFRWQNRRNRFLPMPYHVFWNIQIELAGTGLLSVDLKSATRNNDGQDIFVLELTASGDGRANENSDMHDWFLRAREGIVRGFADLTNERLQVELWGRE
ncbi:MAG: TIGR04255 family protein [Cenarchaeum sp. SB0669_bin_11]|nr:TIGR04255 family protein [Cenarchaeum sp. SB0669_bin_11]